MCRKGIVKLTYPEGLEVGRLHLPCGALPEYHVTGIIHANDVKHWHCEVDAEYTHLVCHGTRLLWVNGCSGSRRDFGSSEPCGKEAGPSHENLYVSSSADAATRTVSLSLTGGFAPCRRRQR
jgi:hypothetical protein